jgi:MoaA/NifB/PqqE/SkfB family radical SAM enzyme
MKNSDELLAEIRRTNHHGLPVSNLFHVLRQYRPLGAYMFRKFGMRSWYSFWYTKLFVADEGGEYALKNHLYKRFPRLLRKPFKIEMEHTTICDKKCIFCEHTYWAEKPTRISLQQFKQVIDPLKSIKWINLTGEGSGFLNRDFISMLDYLRKRHINVNFVDEFDFFTEDIARKVIELGINSIYVSFDAATRETYEKIKRGCSFEKALGNIRRLLELKAELKSPFPVLHFRFIVTRLNYHEMPQYVLLMDSLKNRGVRARVEFVGLLTFPEIETHYIPLEEIPEQIIEQTLENALKCNVNLHMSHAGRCLPSMNRCAAWTEPYILIGGEVVSCCAIIMSNKRRFLRENSFGNVYEKGFLAVWESERYKRFRQNVNRPDAPVPLTCHGCRAYDTEERARLRGIAETSSPDR